MNTKIAIGIPCNRVIKPKTMQSLLELVHYSSDIELFPIIATEGYTIAENRSYILAQAVKNGCDYLFFIDDDMVFPPNTLEQLLSHKKEVIGVPYYSRKLPRESVVVYEDGTEVKGELPDDLFKCQHVGTGIMLIDLSIIKDLERPYFFMQTHEVGFTIMGEDAWFCQQVRKAGHKIWCDPNLEIKHIGDYVYE